MKTLSIKQPWALLIALGIKDIENRSWKTNYRGRIYIHCSQKGMTGNIKAMFTPEQYKEAKMDYINLTHSWDKSAIIGEVDIIDCVQNHPSIWAEYGCYHWVLANPVLYKEPILGVNGKLSLWEFNKELI